MKPLELDLYRKYRKSSYCIGILSIDGKRICNVIEDRDRGLDHSHGESESDCSQIKVPSETCIPYGRYRVTLGIKSPKFSLRSEYAWCKGYLPRLLKVPHFDGILIHAGKDQTSSAGCLIVGDNKVVGGVINSMMRLKELYNNYLLPAYKSGREIWITIHK